MPEQRIGCADDDRVIYRASPAHELKLLPTQLSQKYRQIAVMLTGDELA